MQSYLKVLKVSPIPSSFKHTRDKYHLLVGYIQSGKTEAILLYCWESIYIHDRSVILLLRNNKADIYQIIDRIKIFNNHFPKEYQLSFTKSLKKIKENAIYIGLANGSQVSKLLKIDKDYDLCIDECDYTVKTIKKTSQLEIHLTKLKENAIHIMGVTATPMANFLADPTVTDISRLGIRKDYIGVKDIIYRNMDDDVFSILEKEKNFNLVLYNGTKKRLTQYAIQDSMAKNFKNWTTIVFNGDGIRVYCGKRDYLVFKKMYNMINIFLESKGIPEDLIKIELENELDIKLVKNQK